MKIPILHLNDGHHHYESTIAGGELHFYHDEVFPNDVDVVVDLEKFAKNLSCRVAFKTKAHYICDRCLTEFEKEIKDRFTVLFHLGQDDFETDEDDVVLLPPEQKEIDLSPFLLENLILSVPMKTVCREDCKGLCSGCGVDLNKESCTCDVEEFDPRWDKLREIKNNYKEKNN
ncbi:MAG: DUF177 domain-containing protein [Calditrichia bacterium]